MTGLPLAIIKAAGLPEPPKDMLAQIIAEIESQWETDGTFFDNPDCLSPVSDTPEAPSTGTCEPST